MFRSKSTAEGFFRAPGREPKKEFGVRLNFALQCALLLARVAAALASSNEALSHFRLYRTGKTL
jgi:hypothetical protein